MEKTEIILIPEIKQVPTKKEITKATTDFWKKDDKPLIEKFVDIKTLENVCKIALAYPNKQEVIESALQYSQGASTFDCNGAEIKITKERITETIKKYQFSEATTELRRVNDLKVAELKIEIKNLEDEVKRWEVHEINSSIAVEVQEALTGEAAEVKKGITVTLPK